MAIPLKRATIFCDGLDHPECVAVGPDGVLWAGGEAGQIYRIAADGKDVEQVASTGGFTLGVAVSPDGRWLAACDLKKQCVWRFDIASGKLSVFARGAGGARLQIPNHLAFDDDGALYVSDSGGFRQIGGKIFRFTGDGHGEIWHPGPFNFANGVALSAGRDALFVVCTWLPGVERLEIRGDGSAGTRSIYIRLRKVLPDGLCFDARGNLYIACYTPARIYKVTPRRKLSVLIDDWEAHTLANPTNIAFGGEKFDQLFAANLGRWHITRIDLRVRGLALTR